MKLLERTALALAGTFLSREPLVTASKEWWREAARNSLMAVLEELDLEISALNAAHEAMQAINENTEAHELYVKLEALDAFRAAIAMETRRAIDSEAGVVAKP